MTEAETKVHHRVSNPETLLALLRQKREENEGGGLAALGCLAIIVGFLLAWYLSWWFVVLGVSIFLLCAYKSQSGTTEIVNELTKAAESGDSGAQYALGCYLSETTKSDKALRWLQKANDQGYPGARDKLIQVREEQVERERIRQEETQDKERKRLEKATISKHWLTGKYRCEACGMNLSQSEINKVETDRRPINKVVSKTTHSPGARATINRGGGATWDSIDIPATSSTNTYVLSGEKRFYDVTCTCGKCGRWRLFKEEEEII
jgi:hypothetical protein